MKRCDLLITGGYVVDPVNGREAVADVAVDRGRIAAVGRDLDVNPDRVLDARDCFVFPGLIDTHVHASFEFNGKLAHKMLARAGVTTALEVAGPVEEVLHDAAKHGAGIHLACLNRLKPGERIPSNNPSLDEIRQAIDASLQAGAIGVKILGGHFPLTPEATAKVIRAANERGVYVAYHCRTTESGSNLIGLREAIELAESYRLHLPHINSFCRGTVNDPVSEALEAIALLQQAPQIFSESYLAEINGSFGNCENGVPISGMTRASLRMIGYPETEEGLKQAICDGLVQVHWTVGDDTVLATGPEAAAAWQAAGTNMGVSFAVNDPKSRLLLALSKDEQGRFAVDALATDGGGIPRNVMVSSGLALVRMGMWTLKDFVVKTAATPANVLGLASKGHLGEGADADIAIVNQETHRVRTTISRGEIIMHDGVVFGSGTYFYTTEEGVDAVARAGCTPLVLDVTEAGFYTGAGLKA